MRTNDKGKFTTQIGDDVIEAALKSVDKAKAEVSGVDLNVESPAAPTPEAPTAAPAPEAAATPGPSLEEFNSLKAQLELSQVQGRELMQKLKDEHEKMLRAAADLDNFKKRANKEREETQKFGNERLLRDFLPVLDNFDRGLEAAKTSADYESFRKGVEMTRRLFEDALGKHGVKAFSSKGQPFDPSQHEAMTQAETADMPPNHVFAEMVRGFTLNDRLIRPALVVVSKAVTPAAPAEPPAAPDAPASAPSDPSAAKPE